MDERWALSRRQFLRTLGASGAITASDLAWWEEPFLSPRKAHGAAPGRETRRWGRTGDTVRVNLEGRAEPENGERRMEVQP